MVSNISRDIFKGSFLGVFAKIIDAIVKILTVPLIVGFYGKLDYGLIVLASSLNAYLRLMELGMNTGSIRYFSIWFHNKDYDKIEKVSQSSIVFYGIIGIINAIIFIVFGYFSDRIFDLDLVQWTSFRYLMFILAASAILNWISFVMLQLLSGREKFNIIYSADILKSLLVLIVAFISVE